MKITEIITESRTSPLYHYTSIDGFKQILSSNMLKGRRLPNKSTVDTNPLSTVSFTRDYNRDFVPGRITAPSLGFRVDQNKLTHTFKILPAVNKIPADPKTTLKNLSPGFQADIEKMKQTGNYKSGVSVQGVNLGDLARGTGNMASRWESEERVVADSIPNFSEYITGIVVPSKNPKADLLTHMLTSMGSNEGQQLRNEILDKAISLNVPIVYNRKDYDPNQIKNDIMDYQQRKKQERVS
jgi:hypothetical protein